MPSMRPAAGNGGDASGHVLVLVVRHGERGQVPRRQVGVGELDLRVRSREAVLPEHRAGGRGVPRHDVDNAGILHLRPEVYVYADLRRRTPQDDAAGRISGHGHRLHPGEVHRPVLQEAVLSRDGRGEGEQLRFVHLSERAACIGDEIDAVGAGHQRHGRHEGRGRVARADQSAASVHVEVQVSHGIVRGACGGFAHGGDAFCGFRLDTELHSAGGLRHGRMHLRFHLLGAGEGQQGRAEAQRIKNCAFHRFLTD